MRSYSTSFFVNSCVPQQIHVWGLDVLSLFCGHLTRNWQIPHICKLSVTVYLTEICCKLVKINQPFRAPSNWLLISVGIIQKFFIYLYHNPQAVADTPVNLHEKGCNGYMLYYKVWRQSILKISVSSIIIQLWF